jgi:hypothetical protein
MEGSVVALLGRNAWVNDHHTLYYGFTLPAGSDPIQITLPPAVSPHCPDGYRPCPTGRCISLLSVKENLTMAARVDESESWTPIGSIPFLIFKARSYCKGNYQRREQQMLCIARA